MVAEVNVLEQVCEMFSDGIPALDRPRVVDDNRVVRIERAHSSRIVSIPCVIELFCKGNKLLAHLWIGRICFLGECAVTDTNSTGAQYAAGSAQSASAILPTARLG